MRPSYFIANGVLSTHPHFRSTLGQGGLLIPMVPFVQFTDALKDWASAPCLDEAMSLKEMFPCAWPRLSNGTLCYPDRCWEELFMVFSSLLSGASLGPPWSLSSQQSHHLTERRQSMPTSVSGSYLIMKLIIKRAKVTLNAP